MTPDAIRIYEVSPRDGLQNEAQVVSTEAKVELIARLVAAGVQDIEVTSFVRASWIPQLADAAEVVRQLPRVEGVRYWGLVPNRVGVERAIGCGIRHVATFMSASETHNQKNLNRTRAESLANLREVIGVARDEDVTVRSYISTAMGCPYEGDVPIASVRSVALELYEAGAHEIVLGDTVGMGNPRQVRHIVEALVEAGIPLRALSLHLHDTRGTALANALAAWALGVRTFDGSIAGVGGCPYAPGASGNAATEDLIHMFEAMGVDTGVDLDLAAEAGAFLADALGRSLPGRYHRYHLGRQSRQQRAARSA